MAVNAKAQASLLSVATAKWGARSAITKAFRAFSTDGLNINSQRAQALLVLENLDDLHAALKVTWGTYK